MGVSRSRDERTHLKKVGDKECLEGDDTGGRFAAEEEGLLALKEEFAVLDGEALGQRAGHVDDARVGQPALGSDFGERETLGGRVIRIRHHQAVGREVLDEISLSLL